MIDTPASRGIDTSAPRTVEALSFEEALTELEAIVRDLEAGKGRLEEAVTAYERGSALRRHCQALLEAAEQKVQAIVDTDAGPKLRDAG